MSAFLTLFFGSNTTTAWPCQEDGTFLLEPPVPLTLGENDLPFHDWTPFKDHLAFDWAHYHYVSLQSSAAKIAEGSNLWAFKHGSLTGAPWKTAKDMYKTIDVVQTGSLPFKTHCFFFYKGPKLSTPPCWMEQAYKLNARDVLAVIHDQLAMSAFKDQFDYLPFKEFNNQGERIWSNLMSAQWAFKQAVCSICVVFRITFLTPLSRMSSHKTETTMGLCLYPLLPEATRQLFRLRRVIKNITLSMFRSEIFQIRHGERVEMEFFLSPSYQYQKVSYIVVFST
jgi:hypothetical protein